MEVRLWSKMLIAVIMSSLIGCSLPHTTRTSVIHNITISDELSFEPLAVQPGDEIRWINLRKQDIGIDIPNLTSNKLSCQRGFRNWMGLISEAVTLHPNEAVSLCFKIPIVIHYHVREETSLAGGKKLLPGIVKVGQPQLQSSESRRD